MNLNLDRQKDLHHLHQRLEKKRAMNLYHQKDLHHLLQRAEKKRAYEPVSPDESPPDSSIEKYLPPKPGEEDREQKYVKGSDGRLSPDYLPPK